MSHRPTPTRSICPNELGPPFVPEELVGACQPAHAAAGAVRRPNGPADRPTLYLRGSLPRLPGIAVVGTRLATPQALRFTQQLVAELCRAGFAIYSGGARGIDHGAHSEALRSAAPTVVVVAGGLDVAYPPEHAALYERVIAGGGALVSLWPDGTPPLRFRFLQRNRLLAALSVGLVVVQAPLRSGARSAAAAARKLGRPVWAVPHAPWDERGAGCSAELGQGARLAVRARDVIEGFGGPLGARLPATSPPSRLTAPGPSGGPVTGDGRSMLIECPVSPMDPRHAPRGAEALDATPRTEEESIIIEVLDDTPRHQDELCVRAGLPFARVSAALLTLTLRAVVVEGPAAHYRLARA